MFDIPRLKGVNAFRTFGGVQKCCFLGAYVRLQLGDLWST